MATELTVVVPVFNEADAIAGVVRSWTTELDRLALDWEMRLYDDGSTDGTRDRLAELAAAEPRLTVIEQANAGHGPTVLRGYRESRSEWVFQVDSDGELPPGSFAEMWRRREDYDLLVGHRRDRPSPWARRLISGVARRSLRVFGKVPLQDVNCPFRLMRRETLGPLLDHIPATTFAPNVALCGLAAAAGLRVGEAPVETVARAGGRSSLRHLRLLRAAVLSLVQTLTIAWRFRRATKRP